MGEKQIEKEPICFSCANWKNNACISESPMLFSASYLLRINPILDCAGYKAKNEEKKQVIDYGKYRRDPNDYEVLRSHSLISKLLLFLFLLNVVAFYHLLKYAKITKTSSSFYLDYIDGNVFLIHITLIFGSLMVLFFVSFLLRLPRINIWIRRIFIIELVIFFSLLLEMFWGGVAMGLSILIWHLINSSSTSYNYSSRYAAVRTKLKEVKE